ncbi:MAG TPA: hypothetical protein VIL88_03155 [Devosia sp.]|jgi:hypothetical protein|uniref:hypothetical protein n=1 Tax=Devosia sp. TaxID=1871048 RepID=UPI002F934B6D
MAQFKIIESRRLGLEECEFDVSPEAGQVISGEMFPIQERGSLWEYVVVTAQHRGEHVTLLCRPWLPGDQAFVGLSVTTRKLTAVDRKRYRKLLDGIENLM